MTKKANKKTKRCLAYFIAQELKIFAELARKIGISNESLWNKLHRGSPTWDTKLQIFIEINQILKEMNLIEKDLLIEELFLKIDKEEMQNYISLTR